jgi:hypothetical protein
MTYFSGTFRLKGKSRETLNIVVSIKPLFFKFLLWGLLQPACTPPPPGFGGVPGTSEEGNATAFTCKHQTAGLIIHVWRGANTL